MSPGQEYPGMFHIGFLQPTQHAADPMHNDLNGRAGQSQYEWIATRANFTRASCREAPMFYRKGGDRAVICPESLVTLMLALGGFRTARRFLLVRSASTRQVLRVCVGGDLSRSGHQLLGLLNHLCFFRVHSLGDFPSLAGVRHVSPL